ncbi:MAG: TIGR04283 family arsenosugar biosynthesis glycosyltransferase [Mariprofundales bacterium]
MVPTLNESTNLPRLLSSLELTHIDFFELIFADGGSQDNTLSILSNAVCQADKYQYQIKIIHSQRGRAIQMNVAAAIATGDWLLFLHADTQLPAHGLELIQTVIAKNKYVWGRFDVCISGKHPLLAMVAWFINWRSHISGIVTGDQAIFVQRSVFENIGGFAVIELMEDIAISCSLRVISRPARIYQAVITSGRRWDEYGFWHTIVLMWWLRWKYWRGTSASILARYYRNNSHQDDVKNEK